MKISLRKIDQGNQTVRERRLFKFYLTPKTQTYLSLGMTGLIRPGVSYLRTCLCGFSSPFNMHAIQHFAFSLWILLHLAIHRLTVQGHPEWKGKSLLSVILHGLWMMNKRACVEFVMGRICSQKERKNTKGQRTTTLDHWKRNLWGSLSSLAERLSRRHWNFRPEQQMLKVYLSFFQPNCPEGMSQLGIWGMHHLFAMSLLWLGIFQIFFCFYCRWLTASGVGVMRHFLKLQCFFFQQKHKNGSDKFFLQNPPDLSPQGIHTFVLACWPLQNFNKNNKADIKLPFIQRHDCQSFPSRVVRSICLELTSTSTQFTVVLALHGVRKFFLQPNQTV